MIVECINISILVRIRYGETATSLHDSKSSFKLIPQICERIFVGSIYCTMATVLSNDSHDESIKVPEPQAEPFFIFAFAYVHNIHAVCRQSNQPILLPLRSDDGLNY